MTNSFFYSLFFSAFFILNSGAQIGEKHVNFDENLLLKQVKTLSSDLFQGRRTGTIGAERAKKFIINQFYKLNVLPFNKSYEQSFFFINKRKQYLGTNVIGHIIGIKTPEKCIVISAHYDHEGIKNNQIYNGADDNASGVSALFRFAEYLKKNPPNYTVILAAFDGEELGLQGSKYFVNHSPIPLKKIVLNINLDMISRSDKNELFVAGTSYNNRLKCLISNNKYSKKIKLRMGHDGYDDLDNWTYSSDHLHFYKKEIPFLYFGIEDHKDYHQPTDDFENIHPKFYIEAVKTIISVFEKVDNLRF